MLSFKSKYTRQFEFRNEQAELVVGVSRIFDSGDAGGHQRLIERCTADRGVGNRVSERRGVLAGLTFCSELATEFSFTIGRDDLVFGH